MGFRSLDHAHPRRDGRLRRIEEHILEQAKRFEVRECPYDPYQAAQLVTHLADSGLTMVEFGATVKNFSDPFKR